MNKLFSILMQGVVIPDSFSWYAKKTSAVISTDKMLAIVELVMTGVPDTRRALFASMLCNAVMYTQFGADIKKIDSNNTYVPPVRPSDATHSNQLYCINDLIQPVHSYRAILRYLDDDISKLVDANSWFDLMGAAGLQLLRETV